MGCQRSAPLSKSSVSKSGKSAACMPRPIPTVRKIATRSMTDKFRIPATLLDNFRERVFDNASRAGGLQAWNDVAHRRFIQNRAHVDPFLVGQAGDGWLLQRRQQRKHLR